jgi:hypothetical protein
MEPCIVNNRIFYCFMCGEITDEKDVDKGCTTCGIRERDCIWCMIQQITDEGRVCVRDFPLVRGSEAIP